MSKPQPEPPRGVARGPAWAVVVAGGRGARFGGYKQFSVLAGRELVDWATAAAAAACGNVVLVVPPELVATCQGRADRVVAGGPTRAESVRAGLAAVPPEAAVVVVHDAARPLSRPETWVAVIEAVRQGADGAVPCVPVADTIKQRGDDGRLVTLERSRLLAAQTPQAFRAAALRAAHARGGDATDDAALVEAIGGRVVSVAGEPGNIKVTNPLDIALAEAALAKAGLANAGPACPSQAGPGRAGASLTGPAAAHGRRAHDSAPPGGHR